MYRKYDVLIQLFTILGWLGAIWGLYYSVKFQGGTPRFVDWLVMVPLMGMLAWTCWRLLTDYHVLSEYYDQDEVTLGDLLASGVRLATRVIENMTPVAEDNRRVAEIAKATDETFNTRVELLKQSLDNAREATRRVYMRTVKFSDGEQIYSLPVEPVYFDRTDALDSAARGLLEPADTSHGETIQ